MTEVLYLDSTSNSTAISANVSDFKNNIANVSEVHHFSSFTDLVTYLIVKGSLEVDYASSLVIIVHDGPSRASRNKSQLELLALEDKFSLIERFFQHFNTILVKTSGLDYPRIAYLSSKISSHLDNRLLRVKTWTSTGVNGALDDDISKSVPTMSLVLSKILSGSKSKDDKYRQYSTMLREHLNFIDFLKISPRRKNFLIHCVGHWNFPAHHLTNLELQYCAFLMLKHALNQISNTDDEHLNPSDNTLMGFIFAVRDSYNAGNPFHNFRHAVDVLQATFYYLVKLKCLPEFEEFSNSYDEDLDYDKFPFSNREQMAKPQSPHVSSYLSAEETLILLVAAIGHDVGHPGSTNAFMIKHNSPIAHIFSHRSVLEAFHSTAFNQILAIHWPINSNSVFKDLIISSILATDMSEHFGYVNKIKSYNNDELKNIDKLNIFCSLLIKCADISNVARPLNLSSQWGVAMSRQFLEISLLEQFLTSNEEVSTIKKDAYKYEKLPDVVDEVLKVNPGLPGGQIFFIDAFAASLFKTVVEVFPDLDFTWNIIQSNKEFWEKIKADQAGTS